MKSCLNMLIAVCLVLFLASCATVPPATIQYDNARNYQGTREKVWGAVVQSIMKTGGIVKASDPGTGLLTAEYEYTGYFSFQDLIDCGKNMTGTPKALGNSTRLYMVLTLYVNDAGDSTAVTINTRASYVHELIDYKSMNTLSDQNRCTSTGKLEGQIFQIIKENI